MQGHKSLCPGRYGAPERSQTVGVQCQRPSLDPCPGQGIIQKDVAKVYCAHESPGDLVNKQIGIQEGCGAALVL